MFIAVFTFRFAVTKPDAIRGIIQPKMKALASQAVPNLYKVLSFAKHNRRYFEEWGYIVCFAIWCSMGDQQLYGYQHFSKYLLRQDNQTCLEQLEGE